MAAKRPRTGKQQRFVDLYDGNAIETARKAGYKGSYSSLGKQGHDNLNNPKIREAIRRREKKRNAPHIATREERQAFWSAILRGEIKEKVVVGKDADGNKIVDHLPPKMADRLKSSELLGRSEADFTDKVDNTHSMSVDAMSVAVRIYQSRRNEVLPVEQITDNPGIPDK